MLSQPRLDEFGVVPPCVVHYEEEPTEGWAMAQHLFEEVEEGFGIEALVLLSDETTIVHANSSEETHVLPGWGVQQDWIPFFRGNPCDATGPVLLEMALVLKPQVAITACGQGSEFF